MDNPKGPYDPNVDQAQNSDQPKRSGQQETWPAKGEGFDHGGMKSTAQTGIPPSADQDQGHGQTAPNLQGHGNVGREPQKGGAGTYDQGTQTGSAAKTGRSGGLDRNQGSNKENHEGEIPNNDASHMEEPPFDARMPGEPPRDAENTTPDEN